MSSNGKGGIDPAECCNVNVKVNGQEYGPAYGTPEAFEKQGQAIARMRKMAMIHGGLGFISFIVSIGAIVVGCLVDQINYPVVDGIPLISAIVTLLAAYFAYKISICKPQNEVPGSTRCWIMLHYVFCLLNVTFAILAGAYGIWVIIVCQLQEDEKCSPNHELIMAFAIVNSVVLFVIAITCIYGLVLFCLYARVFGFTNRYSDDRRVAHLERRVAELQSQIDRNNEPPPSYQTVYSDYDNTGYQSDKTR